MSEETSGGNDGPSIPNAEQLQPLALPMQRIVEVGLGLWALGLVLTFALPALHDGQRSWWPWCCVVGLALGAIGLVYLHRGRGNAAQA